MVGPKPLAHWSSHASGELSGLVPGERYCVVRAFTDHDGDLHPVRERWTFLGCSFLPHDDGVSLFVSFDGQREWHIPLQWRPGAQGHVLDAIGAHLVPDAGNRSAR